MPTLYAHTYSTQSFPRMDPNRRPTPADIVRQVAILLQETGSLRTLARLQLCSRLAYEVVNPVLYKEVILSGPTCEGLLKLGDVSRVPMERLRRMRGDKGYDLVADKKGNGESTEVVKTSKKTEGNENEADDLHHDSDQVDDDTAWQHVSPGTIRRLFSFQHTQHLTLRSLPPEHTCDSLFTASTIFFGHNTLLFPRLRSVSLLAEAVDGLRVWVPDKWDRPRNPAFLEALSLAARPTGLCVAYRLVLSAEWETHREYATTGMYQLVSRLSRLGESWPSLRTFTAHDIVHQVLPSVPGCVNTYHFSSHVTRHPSFPLRVRFPMGESSVGLPGPEWNIRPWQMGGAIKNLFPSNGDHAAAINGTSWVFTNVAGHILTKAHRDDDDGTGVGVDEVDALISESVVVGVRRDLPAREGFGEDRLREVFQKIKYQRSGKCEACGRIGQKVREVVVSEVDAILS